MQLDSHHHFVEDWDTKCIEMLHSCDAGEYSLLTTYGAAYWITDNVVTITYQTPITMYFHSF